METKKREGNWLVCGKPYVSNLGEHPVISLSLVSTLSMVNSEPTTRHHLAQPSFVHCLYRTSIKVMREVKPILADFGQEGGYTLGSSPIYRRARTKVTLPFTLIYTFGQFGQQVKTQKLLAMQAQLGTSNPSK